MRRYILVDEDGDLLVEGKQEKKSKPFYKNCKDAYLDAKKISMRRDKGEKIYIYQEFAIVENE
jgi:hypothetical protein